MNDVYFGHLHSNMVLKLEWRCCPKYLFLIKDHVRVKPMANVKRLQCVANTVNKPWENENCFYAKS